MSGNMIYYQKGRKMRNFSVKIYNHVVYQISKYMNLKVSPSFSKAVKNNSYLTNFDNSSVFEMSLLLYRTTGAMLGPETTFNSMDN